MTYVCGRCGKPLTEGGWEPHEMVCVMNEADEKVIVTPKGRAAIAIMELYDVPAGKGHFGDLSRILDVLIAAEKAQEHPDA